MSMFDVSCFRGDACVLSSFLALEKAPALSAGRYELHFSEVPALLCAYSNLTTLFSLNAPVAVYYGSDDMMTLTVVMYDAITSVEKVAQLSLS